VYDSKSVSESNREKVYKAAISDSAVISAWSRLSHEVIDEINILQAAMQSMTLAIEEVQVKIRSNNNNNNNSNNSNNALMVNSDDFYAIVDGNKTPKLAIKSKPLVKGDTLCYSIALASIIAKVERDKIMVRTHLCSIHVLVCLIVCLIHIILRMEFIFVSFLYLFSFICRWSIMKHGLNTASLNTKAIPQRIIF
jgi:ribonuclease HII